MTFTHIDISGRSRANEDCSPDPSRRPCDFLLCLLLHWLAL